MASRVSLIQSRSIYVGTLNSVAPSDGNLIVTGNVGIGTTSPTERLDVAGNGKLQGNLYLTATDPYIEGSGSGSMRIRHTAGQVMYIRPDQAGAVVFFEGVSGQTVYLNTASPSVNSTQNSSSTLTFEARARNAGGTLNIRSTSLQNTVYDIPNNLSRFSITGQDVLHLDGNVGIGTTTPGVRLDVVSSATAVARIYSTNPAQTISIGSSNQTQYTDIILPTNDGQGEIFRAGSGYSSYGGVRALNIWNSNGPIAFHPNNTGNVMYLSTTGNVGIGTTSPSEKLHVNGNIIIPQNNYLYFDNTAHYIRRGSSNVEISGFNGISLITSGSTRAIVTEAGNVGIGTTSPASILHVVKNDSTQDPLSITNTASIIIQNTYGSLANTGPALFFESDSGTYNTFAGIAGNMVGTNATGSWGHITFGTKATDAATSLTERMRITSTGNVGIGTTSPAVKLDVNGAQIIQSAAGFGTDGDQAALFLSNTANFGLSGNFSGYSRNLIKSDGSSLLTIGRRDTSLIGELSIESGSSGIIKLFAGGSERMRITSAGNVGIGTTSPNITGQAGSGTLTVKNSSTYAVLEIAGSSSVQGGVVSFFGNTTRYAQLTGEYASASNGMMIFRTLVSGTLTENIRITGGNVGIGTTAPASKLHVVGPINIERIGVANVYSTVDMEGNFRFNASGGYAHTFLNNGSELVRIMPSGNVGIGTTSPDTPLSTARGIVINSGASNDVQIRMQNNATGSAGSDGGLLSISGSQMYLWNYEASNLIFGTNNSEKMRITSAGNVGIGTTSPARNLHVAGDVQFNDQGAIPAGQYVPDGAFGIDNLITNGAENVALGKPDVWLRIYVDGVAYVFPGYAE